MAGKIAAKGFVVGSVVAPVWFDASAMGDAKQRENYLTAIRKACRIAKFLRELGIRPYGIVRIDSASSRPTGRKTRKATRRRSPRPSNRPRRSPAISANSWLPRARSAGAGCTRGGPMVDLLERVNEPETVGFQADMAHTLLYTLGENAPEDRILPAGYDWKDRAVLDAALKKLTAALGPGRSIFMSPRTTRRSSARALTTTPAAIAWQTTRAASSISPPRRLLAPR